VSISSLLARRCTPPPADAQPDPPAQSALEQHRERMRAVGRELEAVAAQDHGLEAPIAAAAAARARLAALRDQHREHLAGELLGESSEGTHEITSEIDRLEHELPVLIEHSLVAERARARLVPRLQRLQAQNAELAAQLPRLTRDDLLARLDGKVDDYTRALEEFLAVYCTIAATAHLVDKLTPTVPGSNGIRSADMREVAMHVPVVGAFKPLNITLNLRARIEQEAAQLAEDLGIAIR